MVWEGPARGLSLRRAGALGWAAEGAWRLCCASVSACVPPVLEPALQVACCLLIFRARFRYEVLLPAVRGFLWSSKNPLSVWMFNVALQRRGCLTAELMLAAGGAVGPC